MKIYNEQVTVNLCDFDGDRRSNYFGREPENRTEVEMSQKLNNVTAAGKYALKVQLINSRGE